MAESRASVEMLTALRKEARKRVESTLTAMFNTFGRMDREELGAIMDGAQDGVMNWTPPKKKEADTSGH